MMQHTEKDLVR